MKIFTLVLAGFLVGCGDMSDYQEELEKEQAKQEAEKQANEDPEYIPEEPPEEVETTTTSTKVKVDVSVEVETGTTSEVAEEEIPTLFRRGLTMDQVAYIFGEPDDSSLNVGGIIWYYDNIEGECADHRMNCAIYFNAQDLSYGSFGINPILKDHRNM